MFRNYIKTGVRNLLKNKLFSTINISGMAISFASFLLITLFVQDELQFDKHLKDRALKFRVYNENSKEGKTLAMVQPMIGPTLQTEYPEVEYYARFLNFNSRVLFEVNDKKLSEGKGGYADASILKMFDVSMLEGNSATALTAPDGLAINRTLKEKYFGDDDALGKTVKVFGQDFTVTAVFEDFPAHSHFQINYFLALEGFIREQPERMKSWGWQQFHTYIKLKNGADAGPLGEKISDLVKRHSPEETEYRQRLMPVEKIHLHAYNQLWDIAIRGNIDTIYILLATAVFILVIAVLNFVNLSTARAVNRAKEVGLRKVVGAFRIQLINQFICEAVIIAFIALLIGVTVAGLLLSPLNNFTEKSISAALFFQPQWLGIFFLAACVIGITAGAYPALYISAFKPAHILASKSSGPISKNLMRKGLVVLQFMLSFFLIIASLTISKQYSYMRNANMGFKKDNLVVMQLTDEMLSKPEVTKEIFSSHPSILSATMGYGLPGEAYAGESIIDKNTQQEHSIKMLLADHDFARTLGLEVIAGRDFLKELPTDKDHSFILSETGAKLFGYSNPEDALGHELVWHRWDNPDSLKEGKVVGVIKDMQLNSMRDAINPIVLHIYPFGYSTLTVRIASDDLPATLAHLEKAWKTINTQWPFEYRFLDENFDKMYKAEEKLATLFQFFTAFTIFVACLGLFGLVVYNTSQKYKEISIRKVLGAGEGKLVFQLAKNYLILLGIAFALAIPVSYYAAREWLQKFVYRIDVTPALFLQAAFIITLLSIVTVGIQSLKAASANPVDALKEQ